MAITEKWRFLLSRLTRRMWFRASLYGALGIVTALLGAVAQPLIPPGLAGSIGAGSVGNILGILATSMLAVTTFSLATMVSAYGTASTTATPRAAKLLIEDTTAQASLATFIGAFLYSIVGLIALSASIYGDSGRVLLLAATIAVIVLITVTLLRWIEQLSRFGRMGETVNLVEDATRRAMQHRARSPWLGGAPYRPAPDGGVAIEAGRVGYIEYVDIERLDRVSREGGFDVHLEALPGTFAVPGRPLAMASAAIGEEQAAEIRKAFVIGDARTFEHDPRYGLVVLTEVAIRALSPGINDPGTAIDVIGTVVRLLSGWSRGRARREEEVEITYPRVFVPALREEDMFDDVFPPIARDGAGMREIGIRLQKALAALADLGDPRFEIPLRRHARGALARAEAAMGFAPDLEAVRAAARPSLLQDPPETEVPDAG
ncbi:DUF2254 domain-containing protein [Marilutibacter chinensis]|uniref:DUF2254 domain-containing protein n=1 Tax=Marilutibacter chinensis TaxID=2912247 RepID=A0ABS9HPQ3_9GAMM|nr:DUF2254 domain-containing protein [Lysobacter chinensis]MCF7220335.1 DUF2254 domain-containing protein [Lysobacter chinensis]